MAGSGIYIEIFADTAGVEHAFRILDDKLSFTGMGIWLTTSVFPYLTQRAKSRFASEGDEVTGPWLELAEATVERRLAEGFGGHGPINIRTTELESYITGSDPSVAANALGTQMDYPSREPSGELFSKMKTAQLGKETPFTRPRPVLVLGVQDLAWTLMSLSLYIQAGGDQE